MTYAQKRNLLATNLVRFCAVHPNSGVNSNEDTHNNRAQRKPPARCE
jgi:hypothetical protein